MLTEKDYCDYETCVALKELGYKVPTSAYYITNDTTLYFVSNPFRGGYAIDCFYSHNSLREGVVTSNYIDAPTMWEAQKWLREEKKCFVNVCFIAVDNWHCEIEIIHPNGTGSSKLIRLCKSYEDALSEGIKKAVEILKDK